MAPKWPKTFPSTSRTLCRIYMSLSYISAVYPKCSIRIKIRTNTVGPEACRVPSLTGRVTLAKTLASLCHFRTRKPKAEAGVSAPGSPCRLDAVLQVVQRGHVVSCVGMQPRPPPVPLVNA